MINFNIFTFFVTKSKFWILSFNNSAKKKKNSYKVLLIHRTAFNNADNSTVLQN